ncbi:hypothetical protein J6590_019778 [Homalodisca vitripennis]|nr:hypothetical protein J6590_019778 [Homalodisca vitripennis]
MLVKRNMSKTSVLYVAVLSVCIVFIFCELYISYILTSVVPLQNFGHALTTKNELADFNRINENFTFENGRFQPEIGSFNSAEVEGPNFSNSFTAYKPKRILFVNMEDITKTFRNIFFVETRCSTEKTLEGYVHNKGFVLSARQSCAIESTALTNPDREIYVFHSCPLDDDFLHHSPHFVPQLFSYPNVHLVKLNNTQLFNGSPVQQLYEKKLLESSSYPVEHSSDVIRFTLLWKFGGTYFDLDIVTLRSLKRLRSNWVGAESEWVIGTGVMNFKHVGSAHGMLQRILHHINYHYDKDGWASNGPLLLTSFIIRECKVLQVGTFSGSRDVAENTSPH